MTDSKYLRLTPTRQSGVIGNASLWLGPDHLLCVESMIFTEEYKRFYYRDIQAFIIRRTKFRGILGLIILVPLTLFTWGAIGMGYAGDTGGSVFCLIMSGIFGLILLLNFAFGPTVRCYLKSAVQTEELPSLNRLGRARRAIARLRPLIIAAQGQLSPGEIPERMREFNAGKPAQDGVATNPDPPIINP